MSYVTLRQIKLFNTTERQERETAKITRLGGLRLWCPSSDMDAYAIMAFCDFDLWPPASNHIINRGWWIFPVKFHQDCSNYSCNITVTSSAWTNEWTKAVDGPPENIMSSWHCHVVWCTHKDFKLIITIYAGFATSNQQARSISGTDKFRPKNHEKCTTTATDTYVQFQIRLLTMPLFHLMMCKISHKCFSSAINSDLWHWPQTFT